MSTTAFVTGGSGFIGSHLVDRLVEEGQHVRALLRDPSRPRWLRREGIEIIAGDLHDEDALRRGTRGADIVYHLAALTNSRTEAAMFRANLEGTQNVLRACREQSARARFVFLSSQAAGGPSPDGSLIAEDVEPAPRSWYGRSKIEAERFLEAERGSLALTIIRPPAVYGPRDDAFIVLFRAAARFGILPLPRGAKRLSLVHVGDLIDGTRLVAERGQGTYYLSGGDPLPLASILTAIARATGRKTRLVTFHPYVLERLAHLAELAGRITGKDAPLTRDRAREAVNAEWVCSDARARAELGYAPRRTLSEGMRETAAWYRAEGWLR